MQEFAHLCNWFSWCIWFSWSELTVTLFSTVQMHISVSPLDFKCIQNSISYFIMGWDCFLLALWARKLILYKLESRNKENFQKTHRLVSTFDWKMRWCLPLYIIFRTYSLWSGDWRNRGVLAALMQGWGGLWLGARLFDLRAGGVGHAGTRAKHGSQLVVNNNNLSFHHYVMFTPYYICFA